MTSLNVHQLSKSYGNNRILDGISLDVPEGQFVSLLGPSGSGKTTALRCIAGLERPNGGEIRLGGEILSSASLFVPPERRGLGMVFQNYAVWPHLNVFENVAFPLRINPVRSPMSGDGVKAAVYATLKRVRLEGLEHRYPHELSGGQQQRVALARALIMRPRALLLDEPLSNLDAILREELGAEIRRLQQELKLTAVLVTHDQKEALSLSDRIVVLNQGRIQADGAPERLYRDPPNEFVALFFAGGQRMSARDGGPAQVFLPRRWAAGSEGDPEFEVLSRIYLGNEYEYWARGATLPEAIRFFSAEKHEPGERVRLSYRA